MGTPIPTRCSALAIFEGHCERSSDSDLAGFVVFRARVDLATIHALLNLQRPVVHVFPFVAHDFAGPEPYVNGQAEYQR